MIASTGARSTFATRDRCPRGSSGERVDHARVQCDAVRERIRECHLDGNRVVVDRDDRARSRAGKRRSRGPGAAADVDEAAARSTSARSSTQRRVVGCAPVPKARPGIDHDRAARRAAARATAARSRALPRPPAGGTRASRPPSRGRPACSRRSRTPLAAWTHRPRRCRRRTRPRSRAVALLETARCELQEDGDAPARAPPPGPGRRRAGAPRSAERAPRAVEEPALVVVAVGVFADLLVELERGAGAAPDRAGAGRGRRGARGGRRGVPLESDGIPLPRRRANVAGLRSGLGSRARSHLRRRARRRSRRPRPRSSSGSTTVTRSSPSRTSRSSGWTRTCTKASPDLPAGAAGVSLTLHADPLPVVDPAGMSTSSSTLLDEDGPRRRTARTASRSIRPAPPTARAGGGAHELPEDALRDLLDATGAAARLARDGRRARLRARAAAALAGDRRPGAAPAPLRPGTPRRA